MTLSLFAHPFSSYCQKVLVALYDNGTPFTFRLLDQRDPDTFAEFAALWPIRRFPLLLDGDRPVAEATVIIEHLDLRYPGPVRLIPDDRAVALPRGGKKCGGSGARAQRPVDEREVGREAVARGGRHAFPHEESVPLAGERRVEADQPPGAGEAPEDPGLEVPLEVQGEVVALPAQAPGETQENPGNAGAPPFVDMKDVDLGMPFDKPREAVLDEPPDPRAGRPRPHGRPCAPAPSCL